MNIGVIFAGGVGSRMRSKERPKQFLELYNKPIIIHTLEHFENNTEIDAIVVVCVEGWIQYLKELVQRFRITKVRSIVPGGETGQMSIYNGLVAAKEVAVSQKAIVLIHDGVRPLINSELLSKNIASVKKYGSAITVAIQKETMVIIDTEENIRQVPSRADSRVAKAPQSFFLDDILSAHQKAQQEQILTFIDSCTLMQYYGYSMHIVEGPIENIKITTPDDFFTMRAILEAKENSQLYGLE